MTNLLQKLKKSNETHMFTKDEINRRSKNIPIYKNVLLKQTKNKRSSVSFSVESDSIKYESNDTPIPASIEYLAFKYSKPLESSDNEIYSKIKPLTKEEEIKEDFLGSTDLFQSLDADTEIIFDRDKDKNIHDLTQFPELSEDSFAHVPLASEEQITELEKLHMEFYSLLSQIQDVYIASDFKDAYNIQDRISYLLNHRTLLFEELVRELIFYLRSIIVKLDCYHKDILKQQVKFKEYNKRINCIKEYKYRVDESIKIIEENQELAHESLVKNRQAVSLYK